MPELKEPATPEQIADWAAKRKAEEEHRARRLAEFSTSELWAELHRRMAAEHRQWWEKRGIPEDWQDYLSLGYTPDKIINYDGGVTHSAAYTIPYLREDGRPITMQYRLVTPPQPSDKYRFEAGIPAAWYTTTPTQALTDEVMITEGAIKGMTTKIQLDIKYSVLAVPGKNSWAGIAETVKDCGRVWIVLDPDGQKEAQRLAGIIGPNARVIELPVKIDDAIMARELGAAELAQYMRHARV